MRRVGRKRDNLALCRDNLSISLRCCLRRGREYVKTLKIFRGMPINLSWPLACFLRVKRDGEHLDT